MLIQNILRILFVNLFKKRRLVGFNVYMCKDFFWGSFQFESIRDFFFNQSYPFIPKTVAGKLLMIPYQNQFLNSQCEHKQVFRQATGGILIYDYDIKLIIERILS